MQENVDRCRNYRMYPLKKGEKALKKVLIANRGEIASRIIKTCHELGIETVAIYSDADQELPFVKNATVAHRIGEPQVSKSYLQMEKVIEIAEQEEVDAIHPGYGFLSEIPQSPLAVTVKGTALIGAPASLGSLMGDKVKAGQTKIKAGVPVVPGSEEGVHTIEEARTLETSYGYAVVLKASGGGGGIG